MSDDPNEAYDVVPIEPGPMGRLRVGGPTSGMAFRSGIFPARKRLSGMRPIRHIEQALSQGRRGRRRRGNDGNRPVPCQALDARG